MMKQKTNSVDAVFILIMLTGLILYWLKVDSQAWLLSAGFGLMGILIFFRSLRDSTKGIKKIILITLSLLIILLSLQAFFVKPEFQYLCVAMILYTFISGKLNFVLNGKPSH